MVTYTLDRMAARRHLRPDRRRLRPLQHRCALAGAPLREDAVRQRAARARYLEAFRATGEQRHADVARRTLEFMACASSPPRTAASPRRSMPTARARRVASTSGTRPVPRGAARGVSVPRSRPPWRPTGASGRAATGRATRSSICQVHRGRPARFSNVRGRCSSPRATGGSGRPRRQAAGRPGTEWRSRAFGRVTGARRRAPRRRPRGCVGFIRTQLLRDGAGCGGRPAAGRRTRPPSARTTRTSPMASWQPTPRWGAAVLELASALMNRAVADFWDEASGTLRHERRARPGRGPPALTDRRRDAVRQLGGGRRPAAPRPPHRRSRPHRRARSILQAAGGSALDRHPSQFGRMLAAADRALGEPIDAVIAGTRDDPLAVLSAGRRSLPAGPRDRAALDRRRRRAVAAVRGRPPATASRPLMSVVGTRVTSRPTTRIRCAPRWRA